MSEDKNLTNNSESTFEENRKKKVESFNMRIDESANAGVYGGEPSEYGNIPETGSHFSGGQPAEVNAGMDYDFSNFQDQSEEYLEGQTRRSFSADEQYYVPRGAAYREPVEGQDYVYNPQSGQTFVDSQPFNGGSLEAESYDQYGNPIQPVDVVTDIHGTVMDGGFEGDVAAYDSKYSKRENKRLRKKEKRRQKKNKRFFRFIWFLTTLLMGVILAQFLLVGFNDMLAVKRTDNTTVHIEIGPNPTVDDIAQVLQENNVIDSQLFFKLYVTVTNASDGFRQGSFDMNKNMDYEQIVNYMQSNLNRTDVVTVSFYEGMNAVEIADQLEENGVLTDRDEFFELLNSDKFDEDFPFLENVPYDNKYYRLEGYLFPDTYDFYINEDPKTTIWRFLDNFERRVIYVEYEDEHYEDEVTIEQMINDSEYSMDEIIILASIIQAEAGDVEDMYYVSSVLHNRLNSHIDEGLSRLECDSTVYYPYRTKSAVPENLGDYSSRYNTYSIYGLPAGAICNPSLDAIKAAIYPYSTNYYYFCHSAPTEDSPAVAYYATNYDDHYNNLIAAGLVEE